MYFKILSTLIIAFWLATTALLVQMIYFPEESKFSEVPASQVIDLFLTQETDADMDIFSGKRLVGNMKVLPVPKDKGRLIRFLMDGNIDVEIGQVQGKVKLTSELWMERAGAVNSFSLELGMRELGMRCKLSQRKGEEGIRYVVMQGENVLLDSSTADGSLEDQFQAQLLMRAWGIDLGQIQKQVKQGIGEQGTEGAPSEVKMRARRGTITVEGTRMKGYILDVDVLAGEGLTFYFSELGSLLKIDSFLDYKLVNYELRVDPQSEALRDDGTADVVIPVPDGAVITHPEAEDAVSEDAQPNSQP